MFLRMFKNLNKESTQFKAHCKWYIIRNILEKFKETFKKPAAPLNTHNYIKSHQFVEGILQQIVASADWLIDISIRIAM